MTVRAVDLHTEITQLSLNADQTVTYTETYVVTETGVLPDPVGDLTRYDAHFNVKGGDPDTGKPPVEEFRSDVA